MNEHHYTNYVIVIMYNLLTIFVIIFLLKKFSEDYQTSFEY